MKKTLTILALLGVATLASAADTMAPVDVKGVASVERNGNNWTITTGTDRTGITWTAFNVEQGATVHFQQPSAASSTMNRVIGGTVTRIDGLLSSNGKVYLLNPNGIVVGPTGVISVAEFMGTTRDISDMQYMAGGDLELTGDSNAAIVNLGHIEAIGGDVYLIARKVVNKGTIKASAGSANLVAAGDVLLTQDDGIFIRPTQAIAEGTGVDNRGVIEAVTARLEADGNMYAMAINNSGVVRAAASQAASGRVYLTSKGGSVVNSGTLAGDEVRVVAETVAVSGTIDATSGGPGLVETSGSELDLEGMTLNVGAGGEWLIDPPLTIDAPLAATISAQLTADANVTYLGQDSITINAPIVATPGSALTYLRLGSDSFIAVNADVNVGIGRLFLQAATGVQQAAGTSIVAGQLWLSGSGVFDMDEPTNDFGTIGVNALGTVLLQDVNDLRIGNVGPAHGVTVQGGEVHITTPNGVIIAPGLFPEAPGIIAGYHALGNVAIAETSFNSQKYEIRVSNEEPQAVTPAEVAAFLGITLAQLNAVEASDGNVEGNISGSAVVLDFVPLLGLTTAYRWNFRTAETFGPFSANDYALVQIDPVDAIPNPDVLADVEAARTAAIQDTGEFSWQTGWAGTGEALNGQDFYTLSFASMNVKQDEFLSRLYIREIEFTGELPPTPEPEPLVFDRIWDHVEDFPHLWPDELVTRGENQLLAPMLNEMSVYFDVASQDVDRRFWYQSVGSIYQIPR
jgi:filamentous hemagglutinin family protein